MKPLGDRRSRVRLEVVGVLWGTLELPGTARLLNISTTGALIQSQVAVRVDSVQPVRFTVGREQVTVDATVRHFRQVEDDPGAGYLVGLNFVSPPLALLHSIEQLALHDHEAGGEHT
jgi:hypothetical protein